MTHSKNFGPDLLQTSTGGLLTIDLPAIAHNYSRLRGELRGKACAAVVKADAYGLGLEEIAPVLMKAGVTDFFVAHLEEALELRKILAEPRIFIFNGFLPALAQTYERYSLIPVLNSLDDIQAWRRIDRGVMQVALHIDTGMNRLGLSAKECEKIMEDPALLNDMPLVLYLSHLACAETASHPMNQQQLARLKNILPYLPPAPVSFANSSGIFLGGDFHFDVGRPGVALYGVNPTPNVPNPMRQVVSLKVPVLQIREVPKGQTVGYGATFSAERPMRTATLGIGYADGYLRSLSNRGTLWYKKTPLPVIGRVSMDLITVDISALPKAALHPGSFLDVFDPLGGVDRVAREADTIGYEVLTSLGKRYKRVYLCADKL